MYFITILHFENSLCTSKCKGLTKMNHFVNEIYSQGILSPKIEILTMIKVEDVMEPFSQSPANLQKHVKYVNLNFTGRLSRKQQAVCHSNNYHG